MIGTATCSKVIREGCQALWSALSTAYLKAPTSQADWQEIASEFEAQWNLPHVIGALDGKHVCIECPKNAGSDFYNYKGFHSINLMAMCDAHYRFTYVNIGRYGRDNDASIFGNTDLFRRLENGTLNVPLPSDIDGFQLPYVVLGDEIFALKTWFLKPYPGKNLSEQERVFNYRLSRARRTIENSFGILAARWRIFRKPIKAKLDLVGLIVKACVCLHNYLLLTDTAKYASNKFVDSYSSNGEIIYGEWRKENAGALGQLPAQGSNNFAADANQVRDRYRNYVNSEVGSVPWQLDYV